MSNIDSTVNAVKLGFGFILEGQDDIPSSVTFVHLIKGRKELEEIAISMIKTQIFHFNSENISKRATSKDLAKISLSASFVNSVFARLQSTTVKDFINYKKSLTVDKFI